MAWIYFNFIPYLFSAVLIVHNDQILRENDIKLGFEVWQVCCEIYIIYIYIYIFNFCIDHTVDTLEIPSLLRCTSCTSSFFFFFWAIRASLWLLSTGIYICIVYILVSLTCVYVLKEVMSFLELGQLMGVACNRTHTGAKRKLLVAYEETGTNSQLFYLN